MTNIRRSLAGDERGAVLVHVAVAMLALIAFSALAIDYGALLVSRRQAQNSADAAALAGAVVARVRRSGRHRRGPRRQQPPPGWRTRSGAPRRRFFPATGRAAHSVPARRARSARHLHSCGRLPQRSRASNALPTFFAQIVGITSQDVRATATAQVVTGNAVECMKPWAVADKWDENWEDGAPNTGPWTPDSDFDKYKKQGGDMVPDPAVTTPDVYIAPTATDPGTGFTPFDAEWRPDGRLRSATDAQDRQFRGPPFVRLVPGARLCRTRTEAQSSGGNDYRNNITNCNGRSSQIGDTITVTEQGNMVGPTKQGVEAEACVGQGQGSRRHLERVHENDSGQLRARCLRRRAVPRQESPNRAGGPLRHRCLLRGIAQRQDERDDHEHHGLLHRGHGRLRQQGRHRPPGRDSRPDEGHGGSVDETASFLRKVLLVR